MTRPTRLLRTAALTATVAGLVATLALPAAAAPSAKKGQTLTGTITWTVTTVTDSDEPGGDKNTGTETTTVTMKVKMTRRAEAYYFQVEDNGSSYQGSYSLTSTDLQRDMDGNVDCTVTHAATGSASGALPKKPTSTKAPALFSTIVPGTSALGPRTKAIVLTPILRYTGTDTVTYVGSGLSPCQGGQDVDPIEGSLSPNLSVADTCYPKGTSATIAGSTAGNVVGAWNNAKRAFVFDCQKTSPGDGSTVTTRISGTLKLK
jgi:hypothetical protein